MLEVLKISTLAARFRIPPDLVALLVIGGVAAAFRAAFLLRAPAFITNDSLSYLLPGFDLATGLGFDPIFKRPPGYPAFIAGAVWFFGRQDLFGLLILQHLLGAATALLAYVLARRLFGRPAGWISGLLTALSGPSIISEHYLMSESLFGFLLAATLLAAVVALQSKRLAWVAACGVLIGLAALTRPVGQLLVPLLVLVCFVTWRRSDPRRTGWVGEINVLPALVVLVCYGLTVLPWMWRNAAVQQSFTVAGGLGEGLAVRTIRLGQEFDFRAPGPEADPLRKERTIYREEARQGSGFELARRLREEAGLSPAEADRAMREIALQAIARQPGYYVLGSLEMFARMFAGRPVRLAQDWQPWRGIEWEARAAHLFPSNTTADGPAFVQAQAIVALYDPSSWPLVLATFFGLGMAVSSRRADRWLVLLPAISPLALLLASAFLSNLEWRYRHPLEPLISVTLAGGVAAMLHWLKRAEWRALLKSGRGSSFKG
jgi:4-amino-4-deoxy-L-arabinose transferase-like glycosyltransferase